MSNMKRTVVRLFRMLGAKPPKADHRVRRLGDAARNRGDWVAAIEHYSEHLSALPWDFAIWVQKGHALKEAFQYQAARDAYLEAARLRPNDPDLMLCHGHLEKQIGELKAAASLYLKSYMENGNETAAAELASTTIFPHIDVSACPQGQQPFRLVGVIEALSGNTLSGWALDPDEPGGSVEIELVVDGAVVATVTTSMIREDVRKIGYAAGAAGFKIDLSRIVDAEQGVSVVARLKKTGERLIRSPIVVQTSSMTRDWLSRHAALQASDIPCLTAPFEHPGSDGITLLMPVFNPQPAWLREALDSVINQWCGQWKLICVNDGSEGEETSAILDQYAAQDPRVRVIHLGQNVGISAATNMALMAATTKYVAFMDQDDALEPEATLRLIDATSTGANLIYSDEIITGEDIKNLQFFNCRPAFSHDYYLSHPYFVHMICVDRNTAINIGGLDETMTISADVDFILRMIEASDTVAHIPALLYRWRTHGNSAGHLLSDKVASTTSAAIGRHLNRLGVAGDVESHPAFNAYTVRYKNDLKGPISVLRPGTNPAPGSADDAEYYLFVDADIRDFDATRMQTLCSRADVGVVGATVLSSDSKVRHSGLILGLGGLVGSSHQGQPLCEGGRRAGYNSSLISTREYSAISSECFMVSSRVFHAAGGFDPTFAPHLGTVDLCLRIRALGYKVLNDSFTVAHTADAGISTPPPTDEEIAAFRQRWRKILAVADPFYSPLLSLERDHEPLAPDNLRAKVRVMPVNTVRK